MTTMAIKQNLSDPYLDTMREEDRVFLFIDMNNSTQLAEKLGNKKFCYLITQCIADIYPLIHQYHAKLYQIVGDEVVVSWSSWELDNTANVVRLFFDFQDKLQKSAQFYQQNFGIVPTFKGSANLGKVAVSSNTYLTDEPLYHGDVLNTCGGLFRLCKTLEKSMLVTENFARQLGALHQFHVHPLGRYLIKGKSNFENVFAIER